MNSQKLELGEKVDIKNTRFYHIINRKTGLALYISSGAKDFENEKVYISHLKPDSLGQVWQIIEVDP